MLKFYISKVIILIVIGILNAGVFSQDVDPTGRRLPIVTEPVIFIEPVTFCDDGSTCNDIAICSLDNDINDDEIYQPQLCYLEGNTIGACCSIPDLSEPSEGFDPQPDEEPKLEDLPVLSDSDINNVLEVATKQFTEILARQDEFDRQRDSKQVNTLAKGHQDFFLVNGSAAPELSRIGLLESVTAQSLVQELKLTPGQVETAFVQIDLIKRPFLVSCPKDCPTCNYHSVDGSCNNLEHSTWGQALTAFNRFLQPDYDDILSEPRGGRNPSSLPSARLVSSELLPDVKANDKKSTLLLMQMGQLLDHDMTLTSLESSQGYPFTNGPIQCCNGQNDPRCFDIDISPNDNFFSQFSKTCMEFVRASNAPTCPGVLGSSKRQQLNQISSYIDGNFIYGSSDENWGTLRLRQDGRMKTSTVDHQDFLPFQSSSCSIQQPTQLKCFQAGDVRANEVSTLTTMQAVFLKEHNRVAKDLSQINPFWDDETLFQEARRIVIAELHRFIIYEFLPLIIGSKTMYKYGLLYENLPYLPFINAGIRSEFSTAAYRMHTLIPNYLERRKYDNSILDSKILHDQFNDPSDLYNSGTFEQIIYGLTGQSSQQGENWFADEVKNHLFQPKGPPSFGLDLPALNIQRGRDFGIPSYNDVRQNVCGLKRVTFADYKSGSIDGQMFIDQSNAARLEEFYSTVDDIDLFVGGVFEKPLPGARVGETFACIIGRQFQNLIRGDRFWYTNKGLPSSFTNAQLNEIKKSSIARILCDNSDVLKMQPLALLQPNIGNPKVDCCKIRRMDLTKWRNSKTQPC